MKTSDRKSIIQKCVQLMLVPIARFCVRRDVKIQDVVEQLKHALIQASVDELQSNNQPVSVSKIHVMSGVPRLEVNRIYVKGEERDEDKNVITRIIGRWQQDRRFLTSSGKPRVLSVDGMSSDFVKLVTSVSVNLNPYTILFEMERVGAVEKTSHGIKLVSKSYITTDLAEGFEFLAEDVGELIEAVRENLEDPLPVPNHHIMTSFNNIPEQYLERVRQWLDREGSSFHERARKFLGPLDRDLNSDSKKVAGKTVKVSLGSFSRTQLLDDKGSVSETKNQKGKNK